jgi:putative transposase
MSFQRRRLPHQYPDGEMLFITFHLHGSLPHGRYPPPHKTSSGKAFVWMDQYLDSTRTGPMYLGQPAVAQVIVNSILRGSEIGHYDLHAYVVMANQVHLLVLPRISPSRLLQSLKGPTARDANKILGRTGQPFWQEESYDHWVRDAAERTRIAWYIENNPVKAGLASQPQAYP